MISRKSHIPSLREGIGNFQLIIGKLLERKNWVKNRLYRCQSFSPKSDITPTKKKPPPSGKEGEGTITRHTFPPPPGSFHLKTSVGQDHLTTFPPDNFPGDMCNGPNNNGPVVREILGGPKWVDLFCKEGSHKFESAYSLCNAWRGASCGREGWGEGDLCGNAFDWFSTQTKVDFEMGGDVMLWWEVE